MPTDGIRGLPIKRGLPAPYFSFESGVSLNGNPNAFNNSRPSSALRAVVTIVMFMPCWNVTAAESTSGNTVCSVNPKLKFPGLVESVRIQARGSLSHLRQ